MSTNAPTKDSKEIKAMQASTLPAILYKWRDFCYEQSGESVFAGVENASLFGAQMLL